MTEDDIDALASALGWARRGIEIRYREQVEGKREVFVGDVDQMAVSSVSINIHSDVPGLLHLFALDVAPTFRRGGIGTALIEMVERQASLRVSAAFGSMSEPRTQTPCASTSDWATGEKAR